MTSTVADYAGRTIDILAFDGLQEHGEVLLQQTLAQVGKGGKTITGIQKLVQRFLLELFKEKDSDPYSDRGTDFMYEARTGQLRIAADIHGAFARAVMTAEQNLVAEESDSDPDDEKFKSAEILAVTVALGQASITVKLLSQAETDRAAVFPIEIPV